MYEVDEKDFWFKEVWSRYGGRCGNCSRDDNLGIFPIVPYELDGRKTIGNAVVLCRTCYMKANLGNRYNGEKKMFTFWVTKDDYAYVMDVPGFNSGSHFVRWLINSYVKAGNMVDGVENLVEDKDCEVKINIPVESDLLDKFRKKTNAKKIKMTDVCRGLIRTFRDMKGETV